MHWCHVPFGMCDGTHNFDDCKHSVIVTVFSLLQCIGISCASCSVWQYSLLRWVSLFVTQLCISVMFLVFCVVALITLAFVITLLTLLIFQYMFGCVGLVLSYVLMSCSLCPVWWHSFFLCCHHIVKISVFQYYNVWVNLIETQLGIRVMFFVSYVMVLTTCHHYSFPPPIIIILGWVCLELLYPFCWCPSPQLLSSHC